MIYSYTNITSEYGIQINLNNIWEAFMKPPSEIGWIVRHEIRLVPSRNTLALIRHLQEQPRDRIDQKRLGTGRVD